MVKTADDVCKIANNERIEPTFMINLDKYQILKLSWEMSVEKSCEPLISSKDYRKAINSAKESIKNKNKENLELGLQSQFFDVKTECVKTLVDLEGEAVVATNETIYTLPLGIYGTLLN